MSTRPYTLQEIESQAEALQDAQQTMSACGAQVAQLLQPAPRVLFVGCGSALNVAFVAAPVFAITTGRLAMPVPAGDVFLYPQAVIGPGTAVVCISRSGQTTETVQAQRTARSLGCQTVALTAYPDSPLAQEADVAVVLTGSQEQSVTTTGSVSAMVHAGTLLALQAAGEAAHLAEAGRVVESCEELLPRARRLAEQIQEEARFSKVAFVGAGPHYGLAREAQLKFKEMTLLPSDAYSLLDYRHGPMSNVDGQMLLGLFGSAPGAPQEDQLAAEMADLGATTVLVAESCGSPARQQYCLSLDSGLDELLALPLQLALFQYLACYTSIRLGYDPDHPNNLTHYVQIEVTGIRCCWHTSFRGS